MISIHALREEGDTLDSSKIRNNLRFLSTPSARRATWVALKVGLELLISIHALREEGDHEPSAADLHRVYISIHALREEGDECMVYHVYIR